MVWNLWMGSGVMDPDLDRSGARRRYVDWPRPSLSRRLPHASSPPPYLPCTQHCCPAGWLPGTTLSRLSSTGRLGRMVQDRSWQWLLWITYSGLERGGSGLQWNAVPPGGCKWLGLAAGNPESVKPEASHTPPAQ